MCTHHWLIDSANKGTCQKCGKIKDFQPGIDKFFGDSKGHRITKTQLSKFADATPDYVVQGKVTSRKYVDRLD